MPKIVQLSSVHPSFDTRIFHKICKSLVDNGYSVDLIIQHPKDEVVEGVQIKALPLAERKSDRIKKILPEVLRKCREYPKGTIFHFHDPELIPISFFLKIKGFKVIYDIHEDVPKDIIGKDWIPSVFKKVLSVSVNTLEQFAKRTFDHIIVVTPAIEKRFKSANTTLIQNFPIVREELPEIHSRRNKNNAFYAGDITQVRGITEIVEAIGIVSRSSDFRLHLAGKFSPPELGAALKEMDEWKNVQFHGWINREIFQKLAADSIAGLVTFHPIPNHIDAQPNKLFEYMLEGLPVIASDFPLWREIIQEANCGILVDPMNPKQIANALQWLLDHPEEAKIMGKNGRKAVLENYSWANEEKKLLNLYENLMAK